MCGMLMQEFFDGTLQKQLIAAYVPGIRFSDEDFKSLKKMDTPLGTGGM